MLKTMTFKTMVSKYNVVYNEREPSLYLQSQKTIHEKFIITTFLCHGPMIFLPYHLFCLSHPKTCWTVLVDNVGLQICLLGTLTSIITLTFFPRCKPKQSLDKFNNQSQILQVHGSQCEQPLRKDNIGKPTQIPFLG